MFIYTCICVTKTRRHTKTHQGGIGARAFTQITRNHSWKNVENEMKIAWHIFSTLFGECDVEWRNDYKHVRPLADVKNKHGFTYAKCGLVDFFRIYMFYFCLY